MNRAPRAWLFAAAAVPAGLALAALPKTASAQHFTESVCPDDAHAAFHACARAAVPDAPRMTDGRPDFSGYWRRRGWAFEDFEAHPETADDFGGPSVIVDPPDGKVPIQPWAEAQRHENREQYMHHNAACLLSGPAGTMYMTSRFQFIQDESTLVMVGEQLTAHPYRIIPLDGKPHIGDIPQWNGDPRGRWEGDTLVIEARNHNGKYLLDQRGRFLTDEARIVERMTRLDENTIHYEATFEDPNVFTRPFTIAFGFRRDAAENPEIWEEACHETNAEQMALFRNLGYRVFPGITGEQARTLKAAWEEAQR
jgi:hypothetical protein